MRKYFYFYLLFVIGGSAFFVSCEQAPEKQAYDEIVVPPSTEGPAGKGQMSRQHDATWTVPEGWVEEAGSGFRLATFKLKNDPNTIDCSIVRLEGEAGGIKANILRWMNQIHISILSDAVLEEFLNKQERFKTKDGTIGTYVDFTKLQESSEATTQSMIAAIIERPEAAVFVKMAGSKENILNQFSAFQSLCQSINSK